MPYTVVVNMRGSRKMFEGEVRGYLCLPGRWGGGVRMPKLVILLNKFKNLRIEDISRQSPYKSAHAIVTLKSLAAGVQVVAVFDNTCSEIYYGCLIFCTQLIWSWFNECYSCLKECVVLKDYACVFVLFYFFRLNFNFRAYYI